MELHLKMTLYHKLAVVEIFFTEKTKIEAQSTKFKVTPDKTVSSWSTTGQYSRRHTRKGKT